MKITYVIATGLLAFSLPAAATDWFDRVSDRFALVEQTTSGQIVLHADSGGVAISIPGRSSTCSATSVLITAPTGKEREWLAMVLGAVLSGNAVTVYGDCNPSTWQIEANRVFVNYKS